MAAPGHQERIDVRLLGELALVQGGKILTLPASKKTR